MGCMDDNDLAKIGKILKQIAEKNKTLSLKTLSGPTDKACFEIYNNSFLKLLHETVMNELEPYLTYDVDKTMINKSGGKINALTIDYIKHFRAESAFDKFTPHITLGSGEASLDIPEIHFKASKIALCHLGNFCTCRKILYHTLLSPEDKQ